MELDCKNFFCDGNNYKLKLCSTNLAAVSFALKRKLLNVFRSKDKEIKYNKISKAKTLL
jgi:hypothetical protein